MRIDVDFAIIRNIYDRLQHVLTMPRVLEEIIELRKEVRKLMATTEELVGVTNKLIQDNADIKQAIADERAQVVDAIGNLVLSNEDLQAQIKKLQDIINAGNQIDPVAFANLVAAANGVSDNLALVKGIYEPTV